MSKPLIIGFMTEGPTDVLFLENIIARTFESLILEESESSVDIYPPILIQPEGEGFVAQAADAARKAFEEGVMVLCIHTDADDKNDQSAYMYKISPAFEAVEKMAEESCKNLVPILPVTMTEAWMLADTTLLKDKIITNKSDSALKLNRKPESYADPKAAIQEALRIAQEGIARRRRKYQISLKDLYRPIGQELDLERLTLLPSYQKFKDQARAALQELGHLR